MNKQGFAITGILYTLLLIAIVSLNLLLYNLLNRKNMLDQIKTDTVNAIEKDSDFEYLLEEINKIKVSISIDSIYPIGSIYITTSNVDPSTIFKNTTWERYGVGKTLVSTDKEVNEVGGSNTVTLTTSNLPSHSHTINHTHTIASTTISSSGTHTHSTTATSISSGLTAQAAGSHSHWPSNLGTFYTTRGNSTSSVISGMGTGGSFSESTGTGGVTRTNYTNTVGDHTHNVVGTIPSLSITSSGEHSHTIPSLTTSSINTTVSGNTGGGESFSIRDPYITVYMWKRIQ